ncbi:Na/Pi symporter [Pseudomonas songnenensis]|uniref:Na/Pi cotransporter family protein n=2 Tax=Pseudomonas songnenensis TaxID=1176259 RepID=A0ABX9V0T3_9PSED|nr:Na/Pi symporter [Pseudomonas songnenensis]AWM60087.1 Na/Pi cotransporter family protein [Stutzerimonas stutzeri]MCQ4299004.1 Na/Pi symporter [Pseudomonas songnenensis]RMH99295.1 Na/Pi cotransporter family protein [Pseudomonas songnenensis]
MNNRYFKILLPIVGVLMLSWSFWANDGWLELCAGLALFLFGMQCLEEGLRQLAGSKLEQLLARSTATPLKGLLFGISGTMLLQSSTLVSLLTIAFISTGLIKLAGGIAILFGANLGSTTGIWLLALAGQNVSLSPLALPLLVFGVLASFTGDKGKAAGRIVLGIAFIFLGIDQIKDGFSSFGSFDLSHYHAGGLKGQLLFVAIGLLATVVLQSSHATLMLTLTALAAGQLDLGQALATAIGANVGTTVTAALVGSLGGNRSAQRLALAHVLFNVVTALLALALLQPLTDLVRWITEPLGLGGNTLIQLALFHSLFNAMGVALFWPFQRQLAALLQRVLPDRVEPTVLITELAQAVPAEPLTHARYLNDRALDSVDAAASAVAQELQHLARLSLEVICHATYLPVDQLRQQGRIDEALINAKPEAQALDAERLYQRHIKGVYSDLLAFMGRLELPLDESHQAFWLSCQVAALQLVDAVKDAKHLQKNLGHYLRTDESAARQAYVELRRHLLESLREIRALNHSELPDELWRERLNWLDERAAQFDTEFRRRLFESIRNHKLDGLQTSSLMNDLGYASRIIQSLRNALLLGEGHELTRQLRQLAEDDGPVILQL